MRILLTGFEPFAGEYINSSQETVETVPCDEFDDIEIVHRILPVSFKRAGKAICESIDETKPDNDGPSAYFSSLPVKHLRNQLVKSGVPTEVSNTAGLYVCNTTYYAAMHHIPITRKNIKTIFVHLPKISSVLC